MFFVLGAKSIKLGDVGQINSFFKIFGPLRLTGRGNTNIQSASVQTKSIHKLVFLGTPQIASKVLQQLVVASRESDSNFQVAAVVTQPGRPRGRGKISQPSPVETLALDQGFTNDQVLRPIKAGEADFLERLRELKPDVCVTAAYGNILPKAFLEIPKKGTLNIHPSLLPKYRGAAPVQRAIQDGCTETGVSVAFTVRAMDAGPILAQEHVTICPDIQAPELLNDLFHKGTQLLLKHLPDVWSGRAAQLATPQDESQVVHAAKLSKSDGLLDFREPAQQIHNKVRAFAGWPGTKAEFKLISADGQLGYEELGILRTAIVEPQINEQNIPSVRLDRKRMIVFCGGHRSEGCLEILELQPLGKKPMSVGSFYNGLNGRTLCL